MNQILTSSGWPYTPPVVHENAVYFAADRQLVVARLESVIVLWFVTVLVAMGHSASVDNAGSDVGSQPDLEPTRRHLEHVRSRANRMVADLPESEYAPTDALLPASPDGYRAPERFEYPLVGLVFGSILLFPFATLLFGSVIWTLQGPSVFEAIVTVTETATGLEFVVNWALVVGITVLALGVTAVVHELTHGIVFGRYGYQVSYGAMPQIGAFYATPFQQFVAREHVFPVALAPLVLISVAGSVLLAVPVPLVAFFVFQVLVINTVGAAGDLYIVAVLLRKPPGTLLYDGDIRHSYVFEPI